MWEMQQTGPQVQIHCIEERGFIQVECPTGAVDAAHKTRQVTQAFVPFPAAQYQGKALCCDHLLRYLLYSTSRSTARLDAARGRSGPTYSSSMAGVRSNEP